MKILLDSDYLVALFRKDDSNNKKAQSLTKQTSKNNPEKYILNLVIYETATVLSNRVGMSAVKLFYDKIPALNLIKIYLDKSLETIAWEIMLGQTKKHTSFIDCANLAVTQYYKLDYIFSFDSFYPKQYLLNPKP